MRIWIQGEKGYGSCSQQVKFGGKSCNTVLAAKTEKWRWLQIRKRSARLEIKARSVTFLALPGSISSQFGQLHPVTTATTTTGVGKSRSVLHDLRLSDQTHSAIGNAKFEFEIIHPNQDAS